MWRIVGRKMDEDEENKTVLISKEDFQMKRSKIFFSERVQMQFIFRLRKNPTNYTRLVASVLTLLMYSRFHNPSCLVFHYSSYVYCSFFTSFAI